MSQFYYQSGNRFRPVNPIGKIFLKNITLAFSFTSNLSADMCNYFQYL